MKDLIKTVLVDDEQRNIGVLKNMLSEFCKDLQVVGEAQNVHEGIDVIKKQKPDLVFLDIEMPYGNAFDLLDALMPIDFDIIFVTAFSEYALKAFKYSALDYLLKPISIIELKVAVEKVKLNLHSKTMNKQVANLLHNLQKKNDGLQRISVPSKEGLLFISIEDIIWCEASGSYTYIYTRLQGRIISSKNIKEYEEMLPENLFFRVHYSYIINLNEIKKYNLGRGGQVEMTDGTLIDVAVRRKDEFLERLGTI